MSAIANLKEKVIATGDEIQKIVNVAILENREYTVDEEAKIKTLDQEMNNDLKRLDAEDRAEKIAMRMARERGGAAIDAKMREAGISDSGETGGIEFTSHNGEKANYLSKADKVASLNGGQRLAHGTGEMIRAMICGVNSRTSSEVRAAMTGSNNSLGGLLVPSYLSGDVIDLMRAKAVLGAAGITTIVLESSDNTIARVVGEPTPQVKGELASFTPSNIELASVGLFPRTVGCVIESSRELAEDAPNFIQVIEDQISKTMAATIDNYGINGFGGSSLGLIGMTQINEVGSIGSIRWSHIASAVTRLRVKNQEPNGAILYPTIHDALFNTSTGDGVNSSLGWLEPPPSIRDKQYWNTTACPSAKIVVGDFTKYAMGLRTGLQLEATTSGGNDMFKKHGVSIKATIRVDFVTLDAGAFERLAGVTV